MTMKENDKPLPVIRFRRDEVNTFLKICAGLDSLEEYEEEYPARIKAIPGGWRDLKMMIAVLRKLIRHIKQTLPPEKREGIELTLKHTKYKLYCGRPAAQEKDITVLTMENLDVLVQNAHAGQCRLCVKDTCAGCALGKTLDQVLTYDRDGRSWAATNISEVT